MKFAHTLLSAFIVALIGFPVAKAQLLNNPESVVYDSLRDRYLVSNWNTGHMVQIDSDGVQDYFIISQHCYAGLKIVGDSIYVACRGEGVRGFDLETGQMFMHVDIPESNVLNDITADNSGNLYVSDPNAHRIFKVNISAQSYSLFVSSGLSVPNGIYFDEPYNRLLLVSARNFAPLQAISLEDSSLSTIVYTGISILDGLTMDEHRNVYFSAWSTNAIYKYDSTFTNPPEQISTHAPEPADIFYDVHNNVIAVPIFYGHYIDFVSITPTSNEFAEIPSPDNFGAINYPNPFNASTTIRYILESPSLVSVDIYDMLGRKITTLNKGFQNAGTYQEIWEAGDASTGIYYVRIKTDNRSLGRRMTLLK
ncbi:MAG: T9SS type A sorting domain-containing protein [Candidatus Zixiibacteriota bacterium]|nr:MAG: T9SS type A sorting domain-containing protein [candidate division Zixibacteria bacterium]